VEQFADPLNTISSSLTLSLQVCTKAIKMIELPLCTTYIYVTSSQKCAMTELGAVDNWIGN
jgi:hypothetical protein